MKIIEEKNNELLNRKEVKIIIPSAKNPSFPEAEKMISEHFKVSNDLIVVREIMGKFGRDTFLISAFLYKTKADKENTETKRKVKTQPGQPAEEKK